MNRSIYSYLDYRHFLDDTAASLKAKDPSFSFRSFAKMAGSSSPNFLQLVHTRKLNMSRASVFSLSKALGLSVRERNFLVLLTEFDHAKTHDEKDKWFRQILLSRDYKEIRTLDRDQYELFSHWYIPVIRELVVDPALSGNPARIGSSIVPPVSEARVRKGIKVLESLGLIRRENGAWVQADQVVSTPSEVLSVAVANYHKGVIDLARKAIDRFDPVDRDIRSVTLGVSREGYGEMKRRMEAFWRELLAFSESQKSTDRVYQVNMQLFPLSKLKSKGPEN